MSQVVARPVGTLSRIGEAIFIRSMNDFPPASGGVITLQPGKNYFVVGNGLTTANRFECAGSVSVTGLWTLGDSPQLTYTGTGTMFTINNSGTLDIFRIMVDCPNGNFVECNGIAPNLAGYKPNGVQVVSCQTYCTLNGTNLSSFDTLILQCVNGFNITTNPAPIISLRQNNFANIVGGIAMNLNNSVVDVFEMRDVVMRTATAATGISGLANSANVLAGQQANVTSSEFGPGVTPLVGIDEDDNRWNFDNNIGIPDTAPRALDNLTGNTLATVIVTQGAFVPVASNVAWTAVDFAQFSQGAVNSSQINYDGEIVRRVAVDVSFTARSASGSPLTRWQIYKNGSPVAGAVINLEVQTGIDSSATIVWTGVADPGDQIELFVANLDGVQDVILLESTQRIIAFAA